nr:unnamed protein product [Callosobruchus analis]
MCEVQAMLSSAELKRDIFLNDLQGTLRKEKLIIGVWRRFWRKQQNGEDIGEYHQRYACCPTFHIKELGGAAQPRNVGHMSRNPDMD